MLLRWAGFAECTSREYKQSRARVSSRPPARRGMGKACSATSSEGFQTAACIFFPFSPLVKQSFPASRPPPSPALAGLLATADSASLRMESGSLNRDVIDLPPRPLPPFVKWGNVPKSSQANFLLLFFLRSFASDGERKLKR